METRRTIIKRLVCAVFVIFCLTIPTLPVFCGEKSPTAQPWRDWGYPAKGIQGGEFRITAAVDVGLLNPHHWPVMDWNVIDQLYEQYVAAGKQSIMYPWVAESWEYPDSMSCIVKYREGITFHDGTPLNAEVIKYNFEYILDKKNGCWDRSYIMPVTSMEVVDEYTVKFQFEKPFGTFISNFQMPPGYVISMKALKGDIAERKMKTLELKVKRAKKKIKKLEKKAKKAEAQGGSKAKKAKSKLDKAQKDLTKLEASYAEASAKAEGAKNTDTDPVGTGPYILDSRSSGNWIKVKRNPNYWFGNKINRPDLPFFDSIKTIIIPDRSIQLANLKAGKIHLMDLSPSQYHQLKQNPHPIIRIDAFNYPHSHYLDFNHTKGPCQDIRVRKAISHAIDIKALIEGVRFGLARPACGVFPSDQWSHDPSLKPVTYDPEMAKSLLKEAGYGKGMSIEGVALNTPESRTKVEAIKQMLAEVGIKWKVDILDVSALTDRIVNETYDLASGTWPYIYDPDAVAYGKWHEDGASYRARTKNKKRFELVEAGRAEPNLEKRRRIYWELEKMLYDNYENVWLWHIRMARGFHKSIRGTDAEKYETWMEVWRRTHYFPALWFEN
jgi:peptide/nickel transport system substrate-binding protein